MENIGKRLKNIRKLLNKSQEAFAVDLSVTKQAISNLENNKNYPSIPLLCKLIADYNININYLLSGRGEVFDSDANNKAALKQSIMNEVENFLSLRGIN